MNQSSKRFISFLISIGILFAAFLVFVLFIRPAYGNIIDLKGEAQSKKNLLDNQRAIIGQVKSIIASYEGEGDLAQTVALALPIGGGESSFVNELERLVFSSGLDLRSISMTKIALQPTSAGGTFYPLGRLQAQLSMSGNYESFKEFLRNIETNIRLMDAQLVQITRPAGSQDDSYVFSATIVSYYQSVGRSR